MSERSSQEKNNSKALPIHRKSTKKPQEQTESMKMRSKVGWIAVGMLVLLAYGIFRYKSTGDVGFFELNRTCVIMLLLWLAWPQLEALPKWILYITPICAIACAWRPQFLIVVLPLSFLYLLLRPRSGKRRKNR